MVDTPQSFKISVTILPLVPLYVKLLTATIPPTMNSIQLFPLSPTMHTPNPTLSHHQNHKVSSHFHRLLTKLYLRSTPKTPKTPHTTIQAILEPYWHIFNLVLLHQYDVRIGTYAITTPTTSPPSPIIITQHAAHDKYGHTAYSSGASAYPPSWSASTRRQSSKFNHCDVSIQFFLVYLEPLLAKIGARVEWLAVCPKPRVVFHWAGSTPVPDVRHSVFYITAKTGETFVADFTVEQFGFSEDIWFLPADKYMQVCTRGRHCRQPSDEEIKSARRGEFDRRVGKGFVVRNVCCGADIDRWKKNGGLEWLGERVKEACVEFWGEYGLARVDK
jgi:hypothetical protein